MKKYIPNILTTYRLIFSLFIPALFLTKHYYLLAILFIIALLSDAFDGYFARKWGVVSNYGKIVDVLSDKALALLSSTTLIFKVSKLFIITLVLELVISIINSISYIKTKSVDNHSSSIYGKVKTWFLFITLLIGVLTLKYNLYVLLNIFIVITAIMQTLTAYNYYKENKKLK